MNIYVGNLPWSYSSEDLERLFEQHGAVSSANVIMDRATNRSRGFGFVEMESDEEARKAKEGPQSVHQAHTSRGAVGDGEGGVA